MVIDYGACHHELLSLGRIEDAQCSQPENLIEALDLVQRSVMPRSPPQAG